MKISKRQKRKIEDMLPKDSVIVKIEKAPPNDTRKQYDHRALVCYIFNNKFYTTNISVHLGRDLKKTGAQNEQTKGT